MHFPKILRTKIIPPPRGSRTLVRPRVVQSLSEALHYRLTLLQAGAGYGKSTALTILAEHHQPIVWYQITEEDSDSLVFLLHLCHATQQAFPHLSDLPTQFLDSWEGSRGPLPAAGVVDQFINALSEGLKQPALLVMDDIHLAASSEVALLLDRLIGLSPPELHIILAARSPLTLPNLSRWRAQGEVLSVDQSVLAFNTGEILELFTWQYGYELTADEGEALCSATEGWAIALQLIWQSLRSGVAVSVEDALNRQSASLDCLFEVLAGEVFGKQPADVKEFMLMSATLRELNPEACDALRFPDRAAGGDVPSAAMLAYLRRQDLFVVDQGGSSEPIAHTSDHQRIKRREGNSLHLRYHHIFHNFLRQQVSLEQRREWHMRAASYFERRNNLDEAIYHYLLGEESEGAALLLDNYGMDLLAIGRLDSLAAYLDALPPENLRQHPALLSYLGDLARLHSRFQEALGWYQQAEALWREQGQLEGVGRALRGQARVYLDTVNPSRAEELLQQALRLSDGSDDRWSQARLYELLSENKLNAGHPEEAESLRRKAETLLNEGPSDSQLLFRVLLRTGRLDEARQRLEARAETERREPVSTPRAHRETLLILSLIYAFQGETEKAYQAALEGTRRGVDLDSPFITAVGHMRQGHALSLPLYPWDTSSHTESTIPDRHDQARGQYEQAIQISRNLAVNRLLVEAYWGLCRAYGLQGDLGQALRLAQDGIDIATQAGDEWIASLVRLAMGASLIMAASYEAAEVWLNRAALGFQECSDPFGNSAARLWLCLGWWRQADGSPDVDGRLAKTLPEVLATCCQYGYDYLFTRLTLLGFPEEHLVVPLLILARDKGWEISYATQLLKSLRLGEVQLHPGYQLRINTLGSFQVWRGAKPLAVTSWRREKARQLFQIMLTYQDAPLDREQIIEYLWSDIDLTSAQRNFKVTLNTLYNVLEPERTAGSESVYIVREGSTYGLRPGADIWLDAQVLSDTIQQAEALLDLSLDGLATAEASREHAIELLEQAIHLYQGEYLPEARYETWAAAEREHLAVLFLRTADRLSDLYLHYGRYEDAVDLCQRILGYDNCWERAYRQLMLAFAGLGDHGQVARTYQRGVQALRTELDVSPAPETEDLYKKLIKKH